MNKAYRVIWNTSLSCWTVVSELATTIKGKSARKVVSSILVAGLLSVFSLSNSQELPLIKNKETNEDCLRRCLGLVSATIGKTT